MPRRPDSPSQDAAAPQAESNFVGKQVLLQWLNTALQLKLEKVEDVSGRGSTVGSCKLRQPHSGAPPLAHARFLSFVAPADLQRRSGLPADGLPAPWLSEHEEGEGLRSGQGLHRQGPSQERRRAGMLAGT